MFPVETISAKMLDYYVGRKDAFLIDLRDREAYRTGHIKGAINVPYERFEEMQEYDFQKGKTLVLYCERGGASLVAARILAKKGYQTRTAIGGLKAYRGRNLNCDLKKQKEEDEILQRDRDSLVFLSEA